jgi:hypothetical protein
LIALLMLQLIAGGSNFDFMPLAVSGHTELGAWESDGCPAGRTFITDYHHNPEWVRSYLQRIYDSGQRNISYSIWHADGSQYVPNERNGCIVAFTDGPRFHPQQEANFLSFLADMAAIGFDSLHIRFVPTLWSSPLYADATGVPPYTLAQLETNWAFIQYVRALVYSQPHPSTVLFDLGLEMGGPPVGSPSDHYVRTIWQRYSQTYGTSDTLGFSIVPTAGYVTTEAQFRIYRDSKRWPASLGFDLYAFNGLQSQMDEIRRLLGKYRQSGRQIFLQETEHNSLAVRLAVNDWIASGVNVTKIIQWPYIDDFHDNWKLDLAEYGHYLPAGLYRSWTAGIWSQYEAGHFCDFANWDDFVRLTGLTSSDGITVVASWPVGPTYDGNCQ